MGSVSVCFGKSESVTGGLSLANLREVALLLGRLKSFASQVYNYET